MKTPALISTIVVSMFTSINSFGSSSNDENDSAETTTQLSISIIDFQHPTCPGGADGYIIVKADGGTAPYEYNWNTFPNQFCETATELTAGVYFIHITDANGNKFYRSVELRDGSEVNELNLSETDYSPESAQKVVELMTRISPEYCIIKLDGDVVPSFEPYELEPGIYKVEVIDALGCITRRYVMVYEYEQPTEKESVTETLPLATNQVKMNSK